MKYFFAICMLFLLLSFIICSCVPNVEKGNGLNVHVPGLPEIEAFSNSEYEDYYMQYPPVKNAILRCGSEETPIAADDPRLIRLLNFLLYSESNWLTTTQQSYVLTEEINSLLQSDVPMLDITFVHQYIPNHMQISPYLPRMIICGDSYLTFVYDDEIAPARAERFLPYRVLISEAVRTGQASTNYLIDTAWDSEKWIDLLKYAGFY